MELVEKYTTTIKLDNHYIWDRVSPPKLCHDFIEWGESFQKNSRIVALDYFGVDDESRISTVFLGIDHSYWGGAVEPILFETMIFDVDDEYEGFQERYHSAAEALIGHKAACDMVKASQSDSP